ncbi:MULTISPECIES: hypothetical protein [Acinetobacter]|uniref:hypothetical protein n=1 Tax=Acinetobacter TaxID=469 RepID=UPI002578D7E2|nr:MULTISPECIES: hypothetical protein [Acinetobacter]MDM1765742.1 hypothetical protein [Acinetobacter sp. 226-1]MDM1769480.1 hypothetical protein [Acinetobacter sp. 226-4]MDQ9022846.1 hypothetical protein [Acinetobacter sichuanensis]
MKYLVVSIMLLSGCVSYQKQEIKETFECMNYRMMMTAPMPFDAVEKLKQKCIESKK